MARHKTVTHLPAASAPRLAAQLITAAGELLMVGLCVVGLVTVSIWLIDGVNLRGWVAKRQAHPQPREVWHCWYDRRYGAEICEPPYRLPPVRPYYARGSADSRSAISWRL